MNVNYVPPPQGFATSWEWRNFQLIRGLLERTGSTVVQLDFGTATQSAVTTFEEDWIKEDTRLVATTVGDSTVAAYGISLSLLYISDRTATLYAYAQTPITGVIDVHVLGSI